MKYKLILFVFRRNRRTIPTRCDRKSNEGRRRGEVGSTEDLGDIETWLMPGLIPLGSSPVGPVPGRPGRPARTYTQRPRIHINMLARQDIHTHNVHAHFRGGCKMGRCGSIARQKTRQCVMMETIVQPEQIHKRIANAFVSQDSVHVSHWRDGLRHDL